MTTTTQRLAVSALIELVRPLVDSSFVAPGLATKLTDTIAKVERAFLDPPSNVIQIGDHQPEPVHYDLALDAVREAVREERS